MKNKDIKILCDETGLDYKGIRQKIKNKEPIQIGGHLDLSGCIGLTSLPDGLTVGGYLDLEGCTSLTSLPEGLIVGGYLDLRGCTISNPDKYKSLSDNYLFSWMNGKYIKADGIFSEVINKKGNIYKIRKIGQKEISYLVTDGEKFAHGNTLKEAKEDLVFKTTNKNKSDYKNLKLSDTLSFDESIICYRVITGACMFGVKEFLSRKIKRRKKQYTINEIVKLTENEYGGKTFSDFFIK